MLRGYQKWDENRKALESSVEHLDIERLQRSGKFPADLSAPSRLDVVLDYLRETPWAKSRIWRRTMNVPQGIYVAIKRRGTEDSSVAVFAFVLGLPFQGLELSPKGELRLQFEAHEEDNCPSPVVVQLDMAVSSFGAHRFRSDATGLYDPCGLKGDATIEFVEEQGGKCVVAAWEEKVREGYQLHLLWSDGRTSVISRGDDIIWINVVDDLRHVVENAPFASAIAVTGG